MSFVLRLAILLITITSIAQTQTFMNEKIRLGIDVLLEKHLSLIKGKKIALLTNHAGRNSAGDLTAKLLAESKEFELNAMFVPEHGFYTSVPAGDPVNNDKLFGVNIYSLYGFQKKPDPWILKKFDVLVIDIQDIGVRSYTFLSTVFKTIKACADYGKPVILLDRPNPIGGLITDGNIIDKGMDSFVGIIPVSYIHGCTIGELANMMNGEGWLGKDENNKQLNCDLTIIKMEKWDRWMLWEDTGLMWFPTSPHVPTVNAIRGLATLGIFGELGFISIGIGTTLPFQYIGSPNFKIDEMKKKLKDKMLPGLILDRSKFRPFYGMYNTKYCNGFLLQFPLSNEFKPYTNGIKLILEIRKVHPELFKKSNFKANAISMFKKVTGTEDIFNSIFDNDSDAEVLKKSNKGYDEFLKIRDKYLLY